MSNERDNDATPKAEGTADSRPPTARDWREAWRAARENDGAAPSSASPWSPASSTARPDGEPPAAMPSGPSAQRHPNAGSAARPGAPVGRPPDPGTPAPSAVPTSRAPRSRRQAGDPSRWMPSGHGSPVPAHESTPGRPALPGTDPSGTAPAMAVGAALPGGPSTGPQPVPTDGSPSGGGLRAGIAERLTKAKSMTSQARPDAGATTVVAPVVDRNGSNGQPPGSELPGPGQPALAPFTGPPPGPGGPPQVVGPPGLGPAGLVGQGAPAVAGAATGMAAAGVATASSGTVTSPTATIGGAPTTVLAPVPAGGPPPVGRHPKPARPPRPPRREKASARPRSSGGLRRAHLKLTRIDPWTVMKISFMLAIAFGIMTVVAVFVIWSMLDSAGVFTAIAESVNSVSGESGDGGVDIMAWVALDRVLGFATLLAVVDIVLITALSTLGAFLYNLASTLLGGVEVTLVEDQR